jgi:hypothetical protein
MGHLRFLPKPDKLGVSLAQLFFPPRVFTVNRMGGAAAFPCAGSSGFGLQGWGEMKSQMYRVLREDNPLSSNEQVRKEIRSFLQALDSYPDRFAMNPRISFEEHRSALVQTPETDRRSKEFMTRRYRLAGGTIPFIRKYSTI